MDPLKNLPGYALRRASSALMTEFSSRLLHLSLKFGEATVLMLIEARPGITQSEIGRVLDIKRANMAPLTARLDERGLVVRGATDGRSHGLTLTEAGCSLCRRVWKEVDAHEAALLDRIPIAHREHLLPALQALWKSGD